MSSEKLSNKNKKAALTAHGIYFKIFDYNDNLVSIGFNTKPHIKKICKDLNISFNLLFKDNGNPYKSNHPNTGNTNGWKGIFSKVKF
jgi:arsenate reductase-like glutaredoxin family protein